MQDYIIKKLGTSFTLDFTTIIPSETKLQTKIAVQCGCGSWYMVSIDQLYRKKLKKQPYRCISCGVKATVSKPENRKKQAERSKKQWKDDPLYQEMARQTSKILWMDPAYRKKIKRRRGRG